MNLDRPNLDTFSINKNLELRSCYYRINDKKTEWNSRHFVKDGDVIRGEFGSSYTRWVLIELNSDERAWLLRDFGDEFDFEISISNVYRFTSETMTGFVYIDFRKGMFRFETALKNGDDQIKWSRAHHYTWMVLDDKSHFEKIYFSYLTESTIYKNDFAIEWERVESHYETNVATHFSNYDFGVENNGWKIVTMKISKRGSQWIHSIDFNGYKWESKLTSYTLKAAKMYTENMLKNGFVLDGGMYLAKVYS